MKKNTIKSTWFTVGKIFETYPETITGIINNGHEVGSHTYAHIPPYETPIGLMNNDFQSFADKSEKYCEVKGFHSPRGRWAYKIFKPLVKHNFLYDVIGQNKSSLFNPFFIRMANKKQIIRLQTAGDDWPLFRDNISERNEVLSYFIDLSEKIKKGNIGGIGFHPWILFSHESILLGFTDFLEYLGKQKDIKLETALSFVKQSIGE